MEPCREFGDVMYSNNSRTKHVFVYDMDVEQHEKLLQGLDTNCLAVAVSTGQAVEKLRDTLNDPLLGTLHVLGHGQPGAITLGGETIDTHKWVHSVADSDGGAPVFAFEESGAQAQTRKNLEINFWSCRTGEGEIGMNFLNTVAQTTGATVNASTGYVGSSKLGGSWDLNVSARPVPPFAAAALEAFEGVLAAPVVTQGQLSVTYAGELQALRIGDVITLTFIADANDIPTDLAVEFDVSGLTGQTPPVLLTADPVDGSPSVFSLDFTVPEDGLSFDSARVGVVVTNTDGSTALTLSESLVVDSVRPSIVSIERDGGEYVTDAGDASVDFVVTFNEPVGGVTAELFAYKYGDESAQSVESVVPIADSGGTAFRVTVNQAISDGDVSSLTLDLNPNFPAEGEPPRDAIGNKMALGDFAPTLVENYTVDTVHPSCQISALRILSKSCSRKVRSLIRFGLTILTQRKVRRHRSPSARMT